MVTVAFNWCFSCFNWFSYCRGKCICAGQGNTVVSHFVVQRGDFTVAIACVPCGPRRSLIYAWAWWFCVCWKLSAAEQVKTDCCYTPAVVSTLLTPLPVSCPLTTPHHYNFGAARAGWAELPETTAGWVTTAQTAADNPDDDGQPPTPPTPGTTTDDPASHQHHRRPRLATNTTDAGYHNWRPRLATSTTDGPG